MHPFLQFAVVLLLAAAPTARAQTTADTLASVPALVNAPTPAASSAARLRYPVTTCTEMPGESDGSAVRTCPPVAYRRDGSVLRAVYRTPSPVLRGTFRVVDATSYAAFAAVPVGLAAVAFAGDGSYRPALVAVAAEGAAAVAIGGLKNVLRRERPYVAEPDIAVRIRGARIHGVGEHSYSLPSGHSALAFAAATSVALAHPRAAVPSYAWATTVAAARLWHGVHYPSDVVAGAAIGFVAGAAAHAVIGRGR